MVSKHEQPGRRVAQAPSFASPSDVLSTRIPCRRFLPSHADGRRSTWMGRSKHALRLPRGRARPRTWLSLQRLLFLYSSESFLRLHVRLRDLPPRKTCAICSPASIEARAARAKHAQHDEVEEEMKHVLDPPPNPSLQDTDISRSHRYLPPRSLEISNEISRL